MNILLWNWGLFGISVSLSLKLSLTPPLQFDTAIFPSNEKNLSFSDIRVDDIFKSGNTEVTLSKTAINDEQRKTYKNYGYISKILQGTQTYECFFPTPFKQSLSPDELLEKFRTALKSMENICIKRSDRHIYELCPYRHIKQSDIVDTHNVSSDAQQKIVIGGVEIVISDNVSSMFKNFVRNGGTFLTNQGAKTPINEILLGRFIPSTSLEKIVGDRFLQSYIDGDSCGDDLNGRSMETIVFYECSIEKKTPWIMDIVETSRGRYTLRVGSPEFCFWPSDDFNQVKKNLLLAPLTRCFPVFESKIANPFTNIHAENDLDFKDNFVMNSDL